MHVEELTFSDLDRAVQYLRGGVEFPGRLKAFMRCGKVIVATETKTRKGDPVLEEFEATDVRFTDNKL